MNQRNIRLSICAAGILLSLACAGCSGNLGKAIQGVKELQPKAEERNREIEELSQSPGVKPDE